MSGAPDTLVDFHTDRDASPCVSAAYTKLSHTAVVKAPLLIDIIQMMRFIGAPFAHGKYSGIHKNRSPPPAKAAKPAKHGCLPMTSTTCLAIKTNSTSKASPENARP